MLKTAMLISISIVNSVFLILTIWARFQLAHTDWWAVFLVAFIMGFIYQLEYMRRMIFRANSPEHDHLEYELNVLSRPTAAHPRAERGARGSVATIPRIDTSPPHRAVNTTL
ncbi:hypothetical protein M436DRAFT_78155 [Aureobasidium namibiae CBS 147.97]|uniref:Uncharacterized protein n=1 Tax=Aureobasidium namibiae CBS 147.97 TaxID=1043004 RepID=A0A074WT71_9PEZI